MLQADKQPIPAAMEAKRGDTCNKPKLQQATNAIMAEHVEICSRQQQNEETREKNVNCPRAVNTCSKHSSLVRRKI
eukprot:1161611-Pelagomonas_calceolata.AAC.2